MMEQRVLMYLVMGGAVISIIVAFLLGSAWAAFIAAILFALTLVVWRYGYLFVHYFTSPINLIEIRGEYSLTEDRDCLISYKHQTWRATRALRILFFKSAADDENKDYIKTFERTISALKFPVKLSILISPENVSIYLSNLRAQRSALEVKLEKLEGAERKSVERKIEMISALINKIEEGEQPLEVVAYAFVTAHGLSKEEAIINSRRKLKELATTLSSSLGCEVQELRDLPLIQAFEFEFFIPENGEQLKDEVV